MSLPLRRRCSVNLREDRARDNIATEGGAAQAARLIAEQKRCEL
jgi:hypothetical protein